MITALLALWLVCAVVGALVVARMLSLGGRVLTAGSRSPSVTVPGQRLTSFEAPARSDA